MVFLGEKKDRPPPTPTPSKSQGFVFTVTDVTDPFLVEDKHSKGPDGRDGLKVITTIARSLSLVVLSVMCQ